MFTIPASAAYLWIACVYALNSLGLIPENTPFLLPAYLALAAQH